MRDLLDYLHQKGLRDRTIMVYDNGWQQPPHNEYNGTETLYAYGGPKRKHSLHGQAVRTPIVLRWPGKIAPPSFAHDLVGTVNLVPTMLYNAGVEAPAHLPGHSMRPIVEGRARSGREAHVGRITVIRSEDVVKGREGFYLRVRRWQRNSATQSSAGRRK